MSSEGFVIALLVVLERYSVFLIAFSALRQHQVNRIQMKMLDDILDRFETLQIH